MKKHALLLIALGVVLIASFFIYFTKDYFENINIYERESDTSLNNISWRTEIVKDFVLVKPLEFREGFVDAYSIPLVKNQWYVMRRNPGYLLLPVEIFSSPMTNFVSDAIITRIAKRDTFLTRDIPVDQNYSDVRRDCKLEIICLDGFVIEPVLDDKGNPTIRAKNL